MALFLQGRGQGLSDGRFGACGWLRRGGGWSRLRCVGWEIRERRADSERFLLTKTLVIMTSHSSWQSALSTYRHGNICPSVCWQVNYLQYPGKDFTRRDRVSPPNTHVHACTHSYTHSVTHMRAHTRACTYSHTRMHTKA